MEDKNGSAGVTAATFTLSSSQRSIVMVAAFKEPAGGATVFTKIVGGTGPGMRIAGQGGGLVA